MNCVLWTKLGICTIQCIEGTDATFTQLGAYNLAVIEEFWEAIIRGEVRIAGTYACVNNLGGPPLPNAVLVTPARPVPMKLRHEDVYYVRTGKKGVTGAAASYYIHTGHVESTTNSGGKRKLMSSIRV